MLHGMATAPETTLLILGAGGDLTHRLLLPGLASLLAVEPDRRVRVVGADRVDFTAGAVEGPRQGFLLRGQATGATPIQTG